MVIGSPWFDYPRHGNDGATLMLLGCSFGEILPEDIDEFSRMREVEVGSSNEWMDAMLSVPEAAVKKGIATLLSEPTRKDWDGEPDDHFSVMFRCETAVCRFLVKHAQHYYWLLLAESCLTRRLFRAMLLQLIWALSVPTG